MVVSLNEIKKEHSQSNFKWHPILHFQLNFWKKFDNFRWLECNMKIVKISESGINHAKLYKVSFMKIYITISNTSSKKKKKQKQWTLSVYLE